ncbi:MAG: CcoQ/FixQ family Cbb3-type cytochrome c oxidase assembly chaperone [Cycloclasticus sp.]|jgi:cytochrome c oxidase cbb3-type subunit 4|nr:CcoQ/FixQ family Cbb3-type cytochrome c oxidase assembly chaperone [Cycloclasticus sp.]MBG96454.1 CcoQ/FixQ family Cbb3-type cytochrome c oxidase assembly chaperone [Cycloclasticus sp.]HAI96575.1 CcoQ/FixQ family Cbb3-type cytochrome c oxidase assembly chaperone [Methylococcaceae bacterium]|tara:strand:- start:487 stop:660 length:174 start_codon:yes stop_codon:yes gene_type:complete
MFELNTLRSILTLALFILFIAIWIWAWSKDRKKEFKDAANIPFQGDEISASLKEDKK